MQPLTTKKIAIVGASTCHRHLAPFNDPNYEIWTLSAVPVLEKACTRVTRHFEFHEIDTRKEKFMKCGLWKWMQEFPGLILSEPHREFPNATIFPKDVLLQGGFRRYFTSSIAWMLGWAINETPEEIAVYGVDMALESEYAYERPCCEYLLGLAQGIGIKLRFPAGCDLLTAQRLYGYETRRGPIFEKIKMRRLELTKRMQVAETKFEEAKREMHIMAGALDDMSYMERLV